MITANVILVLAGILVIGAIASCVKAFIGKRRAQKALNDYFNTLSAQIELQEKYRKAHEKLVKDFEEIEQ